MLHTTTAPLLAGAPVPDHLTRDDAQWTRFDAGDLIFAESEGDSRLYLVNLGRVRVGRREPLGRECLFTVVGPGDMFGEDSLFDPGPRNTCAFAMTDVEVMSLSQAVLTRLLVDNPDIAQRFLRVLARRIRWTSSNITDTVYADVAARVAKHLLSLAQKFGVQEDGAMRVPMDLTQEQFAHLVGSSRESVNKVLGEFVDRGWIAMGRNTVLIRQSEPLAARMHGVRRGRRHALPDGPLAR